jgi:hypothetical protein
MPQTRRFGAHASVPRRRVIAWLALLDTGLVLAAVVGAPHQAAPAPSPGPIARLDVSRVDELLVGRGLGGALETLDSLAKRDSLVLRDGHQLAHALGRRAVEMRGGNASVIRQCTPAFASGCYHGVVEAFVRLRGGVHMAELEELCGSRGPTDQPGVVYECVHGLGHGMFSAEGLQGALRHCGSVSRSSLAASCRSGVFMEAVTAAIRDVPGAHDHANHHDGKPAPGRSGGGDVYAPCDRFEGEYARSCWLFQGFVILHATRFDPRLAFETCDAAPGNRAGDCSESLGHQLAGLFQRGDRWVVEQCRLGRSELAPRCAGGAALALAGMDWSGRRAARFCDDGPEDWRHACYGAAASLLTELARPADLSWLCARGTQYGYSLCRRPM